MNVVRLGLFQNFKYVSLVNSLKPFKQRFCKFSASAEIGSKAHFDELVSKNKVVIFMKGTPEEPRCGFSNAVVQVLRMHGVQYASHNVLDDDRIREGIKEYSEWPTIPQLFLNGEFMGGCDILIQMHQTGEFVEELQKIGIASALLREAAEDEKEK